MKPCVIVILTLVWVSGCNRTEKVQPPPPRPPPPIVLEQPARFTMPQRSTQALPGSKGKILITLDDITRGQVMVSLAWKDGRPIAATRSLRPEDEVTFTVEGYGYTLKLETLKNYLIGQDRAAFKLQPARASEKAGILTEEEKIEALIDSLKKIQGAEFVRNGTSYSFGDARTYLRAKWHWKGDAVKTAADFIRDVASYSSTTGKPYLIRLPDGTEMKTGDWFRKELETMEKR